MAWCPSFSLKLLLISSLLYPAEGKKVAVCLKEGSSYSDAEAVAHENQYPIIKQIGSNCYVFEKVTRTKRDIEHEDSVDSLLLSNPIVDAAEVSVPKVRVKRGFVGEANLGSGNIRERRSDAMRLDALARTFNDPMFTRQWHLYNTEFAGKDLNVLPVWANNITGQGVIVAILDDGVEHTHPDIKDNYDSSVSWDFLDNDSDPTPISSPSDDHGTRCAGQVAASKNEVCGVGVAYNAKIAAIRMLKNKVEDSMEAEALQFCRDKIDIYSSSWGPIDDGKKMDGPGLLVKRAFETGVKYGRGGKGSIYVWASGNGGPNKDNCNCDGYCSSIYTISISAVNDKDQVPAYVEECTATLAAAYSSGTGNERRIATTDLNSGCTDEHGGTSAAAPLAAGVIALALSANPDMTWRDVQHIIVQSSYHHTDDDSVINGVGRRVNNKIGFGILDSVAMVETAKNWKNVPEQHVCRIVRTREYLATKGANIKEGQKLKVQIETNACRGQSTEVAVLEHVQAVLSISHELRGSLKISLISPSGTTSLLLTERPSDKNNEGFEMWSFLSVQMWGERAPGEWHLNIESAGNGELTYLELILYGTKYTTNLTTPKCKQYSLIPTDASGIIACVAACPQFGYYSSNRRCLPCHPTCDTCSDYHVCTSCPDRLYLYYEENICVTKCPDDYSVTDSKLSGKLCEKSPPDQPWYKGDTMYIVIVVVFVTLLIVIVLFISMHHYRKYKNGSTDTSRYSDGSPYSHTQLKPITATVVLPLTDATSRAARDNPRAARDNPRMMSSLPHVTSLLPHVTSLLPQYPPRGSKGDNTRSSEGRTGLQRTTNNSANCNTHASNTS